tara:strand:- start:23 stop:268 length:246 start_codon:yes stop_codon:yes gene_type:complete
MVYQMSGNTQYTMWSKIQMSESIIKDVYIGKFVLVQLVDETIELTVENNVYSLSESLELEQDLQRALYELRKNNILKEVCE